MPKFPTNAALESAIIAHADEDTPRLAYADWLDEHGDPDRAEFIRVQCRLADLSPASPAWVDLTTRQGELDCRMKSRFLARVDAGDRFYFGLYLLGDHEEPFRRGFPYFIACQTSGEQWTRKEVARVTGELTRLVATTTLRGFQPYATPHDRLIELLSAPVAAELTGLAIAPHASSSGDWEAETAALYRHLGTNPSLRRVKHLYLYHGAHSDAVAELTRAETFDAVVRLTVQNLYTQKEAIVKLTKAPWFRRIGHFRGDLSGPNVARPLVTGLGELPGLHTLDLPEFAPEAVADLAGGKFPALARLMYRDPLDSESAERLARARFPALVAFETGRSAAKNDGLAKLMKGAWFERLRVLALPDAAIGDRGVKALTAHPVAKGLRVLRLGDNPFGKGGLAALAAPNTFPALTTLDLHSSHKRKATPADLTAFLSALQIPALRRLSLRGWPLGDDGAKALAANPALANLARLDVEDCGIGDVGAKAIFASPHLQNLIELQMGNNPIRTGADALADPAVMPRLGECRVSLGRDSAEAERIRRDGLYLST